MADAVILIPGFFGFGRFGLLPGVTLEYFAGVRNEIVRAEPSLAGRIVVHEPPPTGSIDERVASLHEAVRSVMEGRALRHNLPLRADRIHLVGHSAGGVDARLYANSAFSWSGGPRDEERSVALEALGQVVTVSSPLGGTPIAQNALFDRDLLLFGVYLMSILGMGKLRVPAGVLLAVAGAIGRRDSVFESLLRLVATLDDESVAQLTDFFADLENDRQLMNDLQIASLTARTAGLRSTDHPRLSSYVSVSPPPRWGVHFILERLLYRLAYDATAGGVISGGLPQGSVLGGRVIERLRDPHPSDGVVPVASQTLDGNAAAIVEADHLDVVGHFEAGPGITVFKSNSGFDAGRMRSLWAHVARVLTMGSSASTSPSFSSASVASL